MGGEELIDGHQGASLWVAEVLAFEVALIWGGGGGGRGGGGTLPWRGGMGGGGD